MYFGEYSGFHWINTNYNTEAMTITSSGNVGIGTTVPASNLHISEPSTSRPGGVLAPTKSVFKLSRYGTPNYSYNESAEFRIGHGGPGTSGSQLDLFINGGSNINDTPDQQAMTWLYNGNVGIGTTTPNGKLDIASLTASGKSDVLQRYTWLGDLSNWGLRLEQQFNAPLSSIQYNWIMRQGTSTDIPVMSFAGGNVGINTTDNANWNLVNSTYKLAVNGSAIATSMTVKLYANWPDYVFKKDYKLASLEEVKAYIDQNQHLPEIPSEQQIAKEGLNLGEMNKLLMKKVEELTLYLIQQKEENAKVKEDQEKQLKTQQVQIDLLIKTVVSLQEKHK